jgi:phage/plasmid-like protein (TIGR03299 family)
MASGILKNDFLFVTGEAPWHKTNYAQVEEAPTAAEAMCLAQLTWGVDKVPLFYAWENALGTVEGGFERIQGRYGILRDDLTGADAFLGVVGERYTPIQNVECFAFLDAVAGAGTEVVTYETAGSLWGGKRVWMLARVPRDIRVAGTDDISKVYILLTSAHDGSAGVTAAVTPVRVVCNNTLTAALAGAQRTWNVLHTSGAQHRIEDAQNALGLTLAYADEFEAAANALASRPLLAAEMEKLTAHLFPENAEDGELSGRAKKARLSVAWAFDELESCNLPGIRGSRWAGWQAVTAWADHAQGTNVQDPSGTLTDSQKDLRRAENKVMSVWEGTSAYLKSKAFKLLCETTMPEPEPVKVKVA